MQQHWLLFKQKALKKDVFWSF